MNSQDRDRVYETVIDDTEQLAHAEWIKHSDEQHSTWPPKWFSILGALVLGMMAIAGAVIWYEMTDEAQENRHQCQQSVDFRDDHRTMWVELFSRFPESDEAVELRAFLEEQLPPLECHGSSPTPVPVS